MWTEARRGAAHQGAPTTLLRAGRLLPQLTPGSCRSCSGEKRSPASPLQAGGHQSLQEPPGRSVPGGSSWGGPCQVIKSRNTCYLDQPSSKYPPGGRARTEAPLSLHPRVKPVYSRGGSGRRRPPGRGVSLSPSGPAALGPEPKDEAVSGGIDGSGGPHTHPSPPRTMGEQGHPHISSVSPGTATSLNSYCEGRRAFVRRGNRPRKSTNPPGSHGGKQCQNEVGLTPGPPSAPSSSTSPLPARPHTPFLLPNTCPDPTAARPAAVVQLPACPSHHRAPLPQLRALCPPPSSPACRAFWACRALGRGRQAQRARCQACSLS